MIGAALLFLGLLGLQIALVGKVDGEETPVAAGIAMLATVVALAALRTARLSYTIKPAWIGLALWVVRNIVRDTFVVFGVLVRSAGGAAIDDRFLDVPFDAGGDDAESAARRALAVAALSTSPNEVVLNVDRERGTMRVHVLADTASPRLSKEWPL